ncbi:MAG TPA: hypothetical protein VKR58_06210 [Aquella sp.]|nr:hypothetical protein [Aquella sp.]
MTAKQILKLIERPNDVISKINELELEIQSLIKTVNYWKKNYNELWAEFDELRG